MAWPIEMTKAEKDRIPRNGSAETKIGNQTGIVWKIPGTSNRSVDLTFSIGTKGNANNTVEVEIYRGEELNTKLSNKSFQAKTPIKNQQISLPPEPGMVVIRMYQVKVGGWFGGIVEKFLPGMPGVTGRTHYKVTTNTAVNTGDEYVPPSQMPGTQPGQPAGMGILSSPGLLLGAGIAVLLILRN